MHLGHIQQGLSYPPRDGHTEALNEEENNIPNWSAREGSPMDMPKSIAWYC